MRPPEVRSWVGWQLWQHFPLWFVQNISLLKGGGFCCHSCHPPMAGKGRGPAALGVAPPRGRGDAVRTEA